MDKLRILVVEDNKVLNELYNKFLFDEVFEKQLIENGRDALVIFKSWKPEIVLLDIMLPIMSGYMVLKEIRHTLGDMKTPIIMATSKTDKSDVADCMKIGIQGYIVKPFDHKTITLRVLNYFKAVNPERAKDAEDVLKKIMGQ
jgi:DNA-binding response OmpR family regulator